MNQKINDKRNMASSLDSQGVEALFRGDYAAARALHKKSLTLFREMDDKSGIEMALNSLGCVALVEGNYKEARSLHEESLALARELGNKSVIARSLDNLGLVAFAQGEFAVAQTLHTESLALAQELGDEYRGDTHRGDSHRIAYLMLELAGEAAALGLFRRAICLAAVAETQRAALELDWEPLVHLPFERAIASVRTMLDKDVFSEAWSQGEKMTQAEAVAYVLRPDGSTIE
jgi:tetratricopeptide (TPR) repeat protein